MPRFAAPLTRKGRRRRPGTDEGFTIIEVVVASMVVMIALLSIAFVSTSAMSNQAFSQQTQTGASLANQAIEQIRALPFATVSAGLESTDVPGGDSAITTCGASYCYGGEIIPTTSSSQSSPLHPHRSSPVTIGHTSYTVATYVTEYLNTVSPNVLRVTAVVSWTPPAQNGVPASTTVQTLVYPGGGGCLTATNHPYDAPCEASFFASATNGSGSVTLAPDSAYGTPVSLASAALTVPLTQGTAQLDQVSSISSAVQNSGVTLAFGSTSDAQGSAQVTESATSDKAKSTVSGSNGSTASQSAQTFSASDGAGSSLQVTGSGGSSETGSAYATTTASTGGSNLCYDLSPTPAAQTNSLPCSSANATQAQALTSTLDVRSSTDLGAATLVSLGAGSARTFLTNVSAAGGSNYCTLTTGDGCVHVGATRTVGTTTLGGLPSSVTSPTGWLGYFVQITGWTDTVSAEVGQGTASPTSTATGTIHYWNGSGYSLLTVGAGATVSTHPTVTVTGTGYTIKETLNQLTTGTTSKLDTDNCTSPCTRKGPTTASSTSPDIVIDYQVVYGTETWGINITLDLGTLSVTGTYGASPSGS